MKTFKDLKGNEGIDTLLECMPLVTAITSDKEIMANLEKESFLEIGAKIMKKHGEKFVKLRELLGNEPAESVTDNVFAAGHFMKDFLSDKDILDFFTSMSPKSEKSVETTTEEAV